MFISSAYRRLSARIFSFASACGFLVSLWLAMPASVWAGPPADNHQVINLQFDRSAAPANTDIWRRVLGGNDPADPSKWGRNTWVCRSASDPATGACPTAPAWVNENGETQILLRFTEQRSRLSVNLTVMAYGERYYTGSGGCAHWASIRTLRSAQTVLCGGKRNNGRGITAYIRQQELQKIPTGGVWRAALDLRLIQWSPEIQLAKFSADITLNVTDRNNIEVYLPAFGNATPLIDLNLRTQPLGGGAGGQVSGRANLDVCLYDGYNANSSWYDLRVSDTLAALPGRPPEHFSVLREAGGGATDAANRVDYGVALQYNGGRRVLRNNDTVRLDGIDSAQIRAVRLPGIPFPVVCTPTPLTLETPAFRQIDKAAGRYRGTLRVELTPSAVSP